MAKQAALAGIADSTLVLRTAHNQSDFETASRFLTPSAKATFDADVVKAIAGDTSAAQDVFALAFFQAPGSEFQPDEPIEAVTPQTTASPTVTTDTSPTGVTRMVVTGTASVGYVGTDPAKGGHGLMVISRTWTYSLTPTSTAAAVDGWHTDTQYASTMQPVPPS